MFNLKSIFIAGTDTGVGKSVVAGLLGRYLLEKGYRVVTQKWVQTGGSIFGNDLDLHLKLMGKRRSDFREHFPLMMPYLFNFPASPHLSARLDKRRIDIIRIEKKLNALSDDFDVIIIEGTGGLLVPFTERCLLVDLVKNLNLPVLLVAGNRLGAINHTLLSLEALKSRRIRTLGVIFNNVSSNEDKRILQDTPEIAGKISGERVLGVLPRVKTLSQLYKHFVPIGKKLITHV